MAAFSLAVGCLLFAIPLAYESLPAVVPDSSVLPVHHQSAETALFVLAFAILVPLGCAMFALAGRFGLARLFERGSGYPWLLLASVGALALATRLASLGDALSSLTAGLILGPIWLIGAAAVTLRLRGDSPGPALAGSRRVLMPLSLLAGAGAIAMLVRWGNVDFPVLVIGLALAGLIAWRSDLVPPHLRRPFGPIVDVVLVILILACIPDLVILGGADEAKSFAEAYENTIIQFHQDLFLGAANQVAGGSHMLVDAVSQYGVGIIYFIALWFEFVPTNYGFLGLLDGGLTAVAFAAGYGVLRMAGLSRLLSALTLALGVISLVYALEYPVGALLQHGSLRFSMPMALIAFEVMAVRWPRSATWARIAALAFLGLSSIWALESFIYVSAAWLAIAAFRVVMADRDRVRLAATEVGKALVAIVVVQVTFALATLAAAGSLPDWGMYFAYLREFLGGEVGTITYDFTPYAPALALGLLYLASAFGLLARIVIRRDRVAAEPVIHLALAGLTAYGIALFSYVDNRSLDHILPTVALPGLLLAALWFKIGTEAVVDIRARRVMVFAVGALSALMVATAWGSIGERFNRTPAGSLVPGGPSLKQRLDRLRHMPAINPAADSGVRLLDEYMPEPSPAYVLTSPDLGTEILIRSGRPNPFGFPDAKEASWVSGPHLENLDEGVDGMSAGDRLLLDEPALEALRRLHADPGLDGDALAEELAIQLIQQRALKEIDERFRLRPVATGDGGLTVYELVPRAGNG